ncbi:MAG: STAS domain-containing protein [Pseudomonadota bacterium]|nr:STAS domain-containing protein [Pseudomonadota bacterium]
MAAQPALKDQLLGALGAGAVVLDGVDVERADTAVLQLLLLFRRELTRRGGSLSWRGASDALTEAAAVLGLTQTLEMPAPAPV